MNHKCMSHMSGMTHEQSSIYQLDVLNFDPFLHHPIPILHHRHSFAASRMTQLDQDLLSNHSSVLEYLSLFYLVSLSMPSLPAFWYLERLHYNQPSNFLFRLLPVWRSRVEIMKK